MAELVDALVSGTSDRKVVQVRFLFWALQSLVLMPNKGLFLFECNLPGNKSGKGRSDGYA